MTTIEKAAKDAQARKVDSLQAYPTTLSCVRSSRNVARKPNLVIVEGSTGWYEYEFSVNVGEAVFVSVTYASGDLRPVRLLFDGRVVVERACNQVTGGWEVGDSITLHYGPLQVAGGGGGGGGSGRSGGAVVLRVDTGPRGGFFPHVASVSVSAPLKA